MTPTWRATADVLVADLQTIFATRLRAVVAYGPRLEEEAGTSLTCFALVDSLTARDLETCAGRAAGWDQAGLATPLLLTAGEFQESLDAFPLEFGEIIRTHARVYGTDPFEGIAIDPADGRRACEHQVRSHLLHLREGYMESGGRPQPLAELVTYSAPAFVALLRTLAGLAGTVPAGRINATLEGARIAGVGEGVVRDLLALERSSAVPMADAARLFPEYLASVEQLVRTVDAWRT